MYYEVLKVRKNKMDKLKEEFKKELSIKITPQIYRDEKKAIILEKYWDGIFDIITDWWITKLDSQLSNLLKDIEKMKKEPELPPDYENGYNHALKDISILITQYKNEKK